MRWFQYVAPLIAAVAGIAPVGCDAGSRSHDAQATSTTGALSAPEGATDEVAAERAKLSPEDRALVEAQEWCVIQTDERLGAMGPPIKLEIKGQPVFVCCKGCKKKAEADPDMTLAKFKELKAKAKADKSASK